MSADLEKLAGEIEGLALKLEQIGGCSDGNCCIIKPVGMHTNGGCRCVYAARDNQAQRHKIEKVLRTYQIALRDIPTITAALREAAAMREVVRNCLMATGVPADQDTPENIADLPNAIEQIAKVGGEAIVDAAVLRKENKRLREALEPFASDTVWLLRDRITDDDLRQARSALGGSDES